MATFMEIKQLLKDILCVEMEIDETCDIICPISAHSGCDTRITIPNSVLKAAFESMQSYTTDKLEITNMAYREVAIQFLGQTIRGISELEPIADPVNGLIYSIGPASLDYCMFLLNAIVEHVRVNGRKIYLDLRHRSRIMFRRNMNERINNNPAELLPDVLRAYTLKISSSSPISVSKLRDYAASFEFQYMYKQSVAISEYSDIQDMCSIGNSILRYYRESIDSPPQRIYNTAVLDYYTMAMESRDPFTMYISFYHIIEHYFDAVFRKKLTEEIKRRITLPDFSYRSEEKLYELAKYIRKHMNSDDRSGKGNEFESLRYVLMEYVPIEELKNRINNLDPNAIDYYQSRLVPFTASAKTKIAWSNPQGVYTNLATRIYETRNALVHSKSEQFDRQYRPYENKKDLIAEIALIKAVAESVLINSSEIL